jgi:hypothetical protein
MLNTRRPKRQCIYRPISVLYAKLQTVTNTSRTIDGTKRLCGSGRSGGSGNGGVDIGAEKGLSEDGEDAALGLLALSGADIDEVVDIGGGGGG